MLIQIADQKHSTGDDQHHVHQDLRLPLVQPAAASHAGEQPDQNERIKHDCPLHHGPCQDPQRQTGEEAESVFDGKNHAEIGLELMAVVGHLGDISAQQRTDREQTAAKAGKNADHRQTDFRDLSP